MAEVYIYDHLRTPRGRGKSNGSLHEITAINLITQTLAAIRERNELTPDGIDEVIMGVVSPGGEQGATTVRMAPIAAGFADKVPGLHLNRFCASGLEAVAVGASKIAAGWADAAIGGGYEMMSRTPAGTGGGGAWGSDPSFTQNHPMITQGVAADLLATLIGVTREETDAYGLASQERTARAKAEGYFKNSILPVKDILGTVVLSEDEHPRQDTTAEGLANLPPAFAGEGAFGFDSIAMQRYPEVGAINHIHTAGTSSGIVDGAAAVLIGNKEFGEANGLKPRARIISSVSLGSEPLLFLDAPPETSRQALKRAGMNVSDIDLWEVNEAFAVVPILLMNELGIDHSIVNVNGGAIAMGHPLGATGAMILGTLLDELERRGNTTGAATLCAAGGQAITMVIERV